MEQRIGQRRNTKGRQPLLPEMELALFQQFITLREKGCKVKVNWFLLTACKLFEEYYPQQVIIDEEGHKEYDICLWYYVKIEGLIHILDIILNSHGHGF